MHERAEFDKKNAAYFKKRKETAMKRRSVIAERRSSGDLKPAKVGGGDLKSRLAIWNKRVGDYEEKQKTNIFSGKYTGGGVKSRIKINKDKNYGKPKEGSAAADRAAKPRGRGE